MNNKIEKTKKISAVFLVTILIAGTIALSNSSFMTGKAQAQPYFGMDNRYNNYEPDYGMNNDRKSYGNDNTYEKSQYQSYKPDYKPQYPSYGKDDKRDKSKDSSKSVSINKIKCINTNLNINGNNAGNVSIGNKGEGYLGGYSSSGGDGYSKQGKGFDCIINNNNNNINIVTVGGGNVTNGGGNQTDACEECFNANATLAGIITAKLALGGAIPITGFPSLSIPADVTTIAGLCDFLESAIPGAITQDMAELTAVINSILATGPPPPVSQASITALVNCLLEVDFG